MTIVNRAEIIPALRELPGDDSELFKKAQAEAAKVPPDVRTVVVTLRLAAPIEAVLTKQPEFAGENGFRIHGPNYNHSFRASEAAPIMVERIRAGASPEAVVDWLEKVLKTERAEGLSVMALWGVTTDGRVELGQGIALIPFNQVPASPERDYLLAPERFSPFTFPFSRSRAPTVALLVRGIVKPFITKSNEPYDPPADPFKYRNLLDDARLALTCIGPSAPLEAGSWFQLDDPDLQAAGAHGGVMGTLHEIPGSGFEPETEITSEDAGAIVSGFLGLKDASRAKVRVSLERLNQAMRRRLPGDKALELSIALEALLTAEDEQPGEHTYKVGLRASLLVGADAGQRVANRAIVAAVYRLRSAVMHRGTAPESIGVRGQGHLPSSKVVELGASVVSKAIQRVIVDGRLPDWYDLEVGGMDHVVT